MKKLFKLLLLIALTGPTVALISSCDEEEDCSMTARPLTTCNVYKYVAASTVAVRDTLDSLTITAQETDSVILNRAAKVTTMELPLRYTADSTQLVLHYEGTITDTLTIRHTNTPYFVSMDCGYQMKQSISSVSFTRHLLDSIYITYNEPGIYGNENIQLFF